jgi:hypothetical protein
VTTTAAISLDLLVWVVTHHYDPVGARLADGHYSRRKIGAPQFMPPGQRVVLVSVLGLSVFGWWRPHPRSGIVAMNKLDGWTCSIFRRTSGEATRASDMILAAERELVASGYGCGPDGMLTYVWDAKIQSSNPGYCFKVAGWKVHPTRPRSADGKKTLLTKPFELAGVAP